ncbi:hypothetical protein JQ609_12090 [Bradyrhizobium sp. AUGA SZCCT0169]|nr:hypothetical protein [Bradyrhizobium sp. AUGA SZCCT0169]MBR1193903.1 hypothetical protein [Bradyrhizobium sp. AUGA SZCCT0160]MBR1247675.1 hypothetical protein [Bradyrhizobium sp. AUGA SZCCT0169]
MRELQASDSNASRHMLGRMHKISPLFDAYTLPSGLALIGATLTPLCSLFLFAPASTGLADAMLIAFMTASLAAAVFYYTGVQLLSTFGLPRDATMREFHRFITSDNHGS